ncbi:MAG: hypothetical protein ABJD53_03380 [Gammaproteobacteria bacterium]
MKLHLPTSVWPVLLLWVLGAANAAAAPVSRLEVHIITGADELAAGSSLELRIYEAGKSARRLPLVHGDSWPRDSTHVIPVRLSEALDPRNVVRFGLYYRSASPLARSFEIVAADVLLPSSAAQPERLLDATLSGVISGGGELATLDREQSALTCKSDADCDDKRSCNGHERCAPRAAGADARGCVKGIPVACPVNQVCGEGVGCRGMSEPPKPKEPPTSQDSPAAQDPPQP